VLVALLFTLSLRNLTGVDTGFSFDNLVVTDIDFGGLAVPADRRLRLQRELLDGVRSIPGVTSAAQVSMVPFGGWSARDEVRLEGRPQHRLPASMNDVSARYFETMRTPLVAGRDFDDRDASGSPTVVIVNQTFARRYLGGTSAIGQRIQMRTGPQQWSTAEIVGLVNDTTYVDLREPFQPIVYRAAAQERDPGTDLRVVLRSGLSLAGVRSAVTKMAARHNPEITLSFRAFPTMVRETLLRDWLMATLSGFFGVLALVLASIGLYGVMAYMAVPGRVKHPTTPVILDGKALHVFPKTLHDIVSIWEPSARAHSRMTSVVGRSFRIPPSLANNRLEVEDRPQNGAQNRTLSVGIRAVLMLSAVAVFIAATEALAEVVVVVVPIDVEATVTVVGILIGKGALVVGPRAILPIGLPGAMALVITVVHGLPEQIHAVSIGLVGLAPTRVPIVRGRGEVGIAAIGGGRLTLGRQLLLVEARHVLLLNGVLRPTVLLLQLC
jgi:hypothetical protein